MKSQLLKANALTCVFLRLVTKSPLDSANSALCESRPWFQGRSSGERLSRQSQPQVAHSSRPVLMAIQFSTGTFTAPSASGRIVRDDQRESRRTRVVGLKPDSSGSYLRRSRAPRL
jgi:hypothetical protein